MALEIDTVARSLFEKIRARFEKVSVGNQEAKTAKEPGEARFFNFDYVDANGENFGNVTISLVDENSLKIYFGKNLSAELNDQQKAEWYDFLRDIRMFAKRNMLSFDTRDISRSNLNIKDLQQLSQFEKPSTDVSAVAESKLFGTAKTSYEPIAPGVRLIIRHSANVNDEIRGDRSRKIHKIYIEDPDGQRFMSPFTHVGGSRALGRHIANGGSFADEFGAHIIGLIDELCKLKKFLTGSRNKTFEDGEANKMVAAAKERYAKVHRILSKIKGPKGYKFYKEQWSPEDSSNNIDTVSLKEKFTMKRFDDRMEDGLPYVHKAYQSMQKEFEESLNQIAEGTWAVPDNEIAIKHLQELMSDVFPAGIDGHDAQGVLYDIIGDDDLFDRIYDASRGSPEMDCRPIIYDWLKSNMPDVFQKIKGSMGQKQPSQEQPPQPQEQPAQESVTPEVSDHELSEMRRLAGLA